MLAFSNIEFNAATHMNFEGNSSFVGKLKLAPLNDVAGVPSPSVVSQFLSGVKSIP